MTRVPLLRAAAALALSAALGACAAGPTPYAPAVERDGYADSRIEDNRFLVSFNGNSRTPRETVETYLLYRAAEVTLENGFDHFRIARRDTETETRYYVDGYGRSPFYPYYGFGYGSRSGVGIGFGFSSGVARPVRRFEGSAEILAFAGPKPPQDPQAYDAAEVIAALGPAIRRPAPPD